MAEELSSGIKIPSGTQIALKSIDPCICSLGKVRDDSEWPLIESEKERTHAKRGAPVISGNKYNSNMGVSPRPHLDSEK